MNLSNTQIRKWSDTFRAWTHPRVITMLFLGFSAGVPILLIFSTLSAWLREAGVSKSAVTFFSWAALGYSFKFVWAPIIDQMPFPFLTKMMGRRRGWLLVSQFMIMAAITWMALTNPTAGSSSLTIMAMATVLLGFSSATQDIVIDAYRIECVEESFQALLSSMYIAGYRIGMLVAGAGSLFLADYLGTTKDNYSYTAWQYTYLAMAAVMLVGVITTLVIPEPELPNNNKKIYLTQDYIKFFCIFLIGTMVFIATFFLSGQFFDGIRDSLIQTMPLHKKLIGFCVGFSQLFSSIGLAGLTVFFISKTGFVNKELVSHAYVAPVKDFFERYHIKTALLLLLLVGFYRLSDIVLGVISNVFYIDIGFTKTQIAGITKGFGLFMTLTGGFLGGVLTLRYGVFSILFLGALLSSATNLLFMILAQSSPDIWLLATVIAADNLSAGLAATAFVAFLSSLTSISFTAVQYAIFSSIMTLFPKIIGGYSGTMVNATSYETFFLITALIGIPVLAIIWLAKRLVNQPAKDG